jgi:hypothetical protein
LNNVRAKGDGFVGEHESKQGIIPDVTCRAYSTI